MGCSGHGGSSIAVSFLVYAYEVGRCTDGDILMCHSWGSGCGMHDQGGTSKVKQVPAVAWDHDHMVGGWAVAHRHAGPPPCWPWLGGRTCAAEREHQPIAPPTSVHRPPPHACSPTCTPVHRPPPHACSPTCTPVHRPPPHACSPTCTPVHRPPPYACSLTPPPRLFTDLHD